MTASHCLACRADVTPATGDDEPCPTCGTPTRLRERWRVLGPLARGGSARVFRGEDLETGAAGREVALKVLDLADVEDWKQVELFERQLPLLRALRHRGIPEVHDTFELSSGGRTQLVLVQSLHRGPNLRDALAGGRRFDERSARAFLDRMLDILGYLHGFSPPILHRDVKPANILLDVPEDGDLGRAQPVLIDFDTARGVAIDAAAADGTMVGSAGFVPIEQLAGRPVPASDLYGLGMTVIAALSQRDVLDMPVARGRVQFRSFVNVSPELAGVLEKMIEPLVEDRLPDVAAVRRALKQSSPPPSSARRLYVTLGLVSIVGVSAVGAFVTLRAPRPAAPPPRPAPRVSSASPATPSPPAETPSSDPTSAPSQRVVEDTARALCRAAIDPSCEVLLSHTDSIYYLGSSVALRGDRMAVGSNVQPGVVNLYERRDDGWAYAGRLSAPDSAEPTFSRRFGETVAMDGETVAVTQGKREGSEVHVYAYGAGGWTRQGDLVAPGRYLGVRLALSGDTLAATSVKDRVIAVEVYVRTGATWKRQATLGDFERQPGYGALALSGDTLVIGDPVIGGARVYTRARSTWTERAVLRPKDGSRRLGQAVALDGDTLAVAGTSEVRVYARAGATWIERAVLRAPDQGPKHSFGDALALSGDVLAVVGFWMRGTADDPRLAGEILLYTRDGDTWRHDRTLDASLASHSGIPRVALDAGTLAIANPGLVAPADTAPAVAERILTSGGVLLLPAR